MSISTLLILLAILLLFWVTGFFIHKFFVVPFFYIPKLFLSEMLVFLGENDCIYVTHRSLTANEVKQKSEKDKLVFLEKIALVHSEYIVIAYSKKDYLYKMYRLRITNNFLHLMGMRSLRFVLENDKEINRKLQEEYAARISVVTDKCPACKARITKNEHKCSSCGLTVHE